MSKSCSYLLDNTSDTRLSPEERVVNEKMCRCCQPERKDGFANAKPLQNRRACPERSRGNLIPVRAEVAASGRSHHVPNHSRENALHRRSGCGIAGVLRLRCRPLRGRQLRSESQPSLKYHGTLKVQRTDHLSCVVLPRARFPSARFACSGPARGPLVKARGFGMTPLSRGKSTHCGSVCSVLRLWVS